MSQRNAGFTLIEMMIVLVIIGILAWVVFPAVSKYLINGRDTARLTALSQIA